MLMHMNIWNHLNCINRDFNYECTFEILYRSDGNDWWRSHVDAVDFWQVQGLFSYITAEWFFSIIQHRRLRVTLLINNAQIFDWIICFNMFNISWRRPWNVSKNAVSELDIQITTWFFRINMTRPFYDHRLLDLEKQWIPRWIP